MSLVSQACMSVHHDQILSLSDSKALVAHMEKLERVIFKAYDCLGSAEDVKDILSEITEPKPRWGDAPIVDDMSGMGPPCECGARGLTPREASREICGVCIDINK